MDSLSSKDAVIFSEMVENIEHDLNTTGSSIICTNPKLFISGKTGCFDHTAMHANLNAMVLSSVGFHTLGLPELLVMVGPCRGELPIDEEELYRRTCHVAEYLRNTITHIRGGNGNPIEGSDAVNIEGRMYAFNKPSPAQAMTYLKTSPLAEVYYDYKGIDDIIIVLPMFTDDLSAFKHVASKLRH